MVEEFLVFLLLLTSLPIVSWLWIKRLSRLWTVAENQQEASARRSERESAKPDNEARLSFYRDLFLCTIVVGLIAYGIIALSVSALDALATYLLRLASTLEHFHPIVGGIPMESAANSAVRVLMSASAFVIAFGVLLAFIPEIYPWQKGTPLSTSLSVITAFLLSASFAIWLGTSTSAFGVLLDQLTQGLLGVMITFLSLLFGAIGVYFFWKRVKILIKPK